MIKIIKEGKKSFITTCPKCGCEFEYELADIIVSGVVYCPCCGESIIHEKQSGGKRAKDGLDVEIPLPYTVYPTSLTKVVTATDTSEK